MLGDSVILYITSIILVEKVGKFISGIVILIVNSVLFLGKEFIVIGKGLAVLTFVELSETLAFTLVGK